MEETPTIPGRLCCGGRGPEARRAVHDSSLMRLSRHLTRESASLSLIITPPGMTNAQKLRVYRNATLTTELRLLESPVAVRAFYPTYTDSRAPKIPLLAVAAGPYVFVCAYTWTACTRDCTVCGLSAEEL